MNEEEREPRTGESPQTSRRRTTKAVIATAVFLAVVFGVFALITILRYTT